MKSLSINIPELKANLTIATPIVLTQVGSMSMLMVDIFVLGKTDPIQLAALAAGNSVCWTLIVIAIALLNGLDTYVSQAFGKNNTTLVDRLLIQGLWIGLMIIGLAIPIILGGQHFYHLTGAAPEICEAMKPYIYSVLPGVPLIILFAVMQKYWQAQAIVKPFFIIIIVSNLLNYLLDTAFVFGQWGFPALGAQGVGYSTSICQGFAFLCTLGFSIRQWRLQNRTFPSWAIDFSWIKKLLGLGIPSFAQIGLEVFAFNLSTILAASLGAKVLATHQIAFTLSGFAFMFPLGFSIATAVRVGYHIGRDDPKLAKEVGGINIIIGGCFMTVFATLFVTTPEQIVSLFTGNTELIAYVVNIMFICAVFQIVDGFQIVAAGALRGWGDTKSVFYSNLFSYYCVGFPLSLLLIFRYELGLQGVWIGLATGVSLCCLINVWCWRWTIKTHPEGKVRLGQEKAVKSEGRTANNTEILT